MKGKEETNYLQEIGLFTQKKTGGSEGKLLA